MSSTDFVAIIGAGEIGAATAFALARRARVADVRLIDGAGTVAAGKALDMRQTGPIEGFDTRLSGHTGVLDAVGASAIVIADAVDTGEWAGDTGLALVKKLVTAGATAPLVFAGPHQPWLMEAAVRELGVPADRLLGTAASAVHAGVRALVALEVQGSAMDVQLPVVGRGPAFTIGWTSGTVAGTALASAMPPHRMLAVADLAKRVWPPKAQAIGVATAIVVEGLLSGARRQLFATTVLDGDFGERGVAAMLPLSVAHGRIARRFTPSLSTQERVDLQNALSRR